MKVVLDTNVIVSAAMAERDERQSRRWWLVRIALIEQRRFVNVTSEPLMAELASVLQEPGKLEAEDAKDFADEIADASDFVRIHRLPMGLRDPRDDMVVETAMNADVDAVVSDDLDLHDDRARRLLGKTGIGIRARPIRSLTSFEMLCELSGTPPFSLLVLPTLAA
ncbi:MAG: putative toxin-antitoxin system toxin component, PIN family [Candidatus Eremiobacteraeota bacterium]|nr:putative toxin-antitoxin system toxin component, PIN family [Candidatus Eremiobacteraeota bacterium]MBV8643157.1 putative toxin-antitoxin system toxin component, PIN family [Candidatus Eremiobacteraeota bacterium]